MARTPEEKREIRRLWRLRCPDKVRAIRKRHAAKVKTDPARKEHYAASQRQRTRKWKKMHPEQAALGARRRVLKRIYGMTEEQYHDLYVRQGGKCALCFEPRGYRKLCIDHNHKTGMVRGLLCSMCNRLLGQIDGKMHILDLYFYLTKRSSSLRKVA